MIWSQQDDLTSCVCAESALFRQEKHVAEDIIRRSLLGVMFRSHLDSPFSLKQTGHCPCSSKLCHRGRQFLLILHSCFTGSMDAVTNHLPA